MTTVRPDRTGGRTGARSEGHRRVPLAVAAVLALVAVLALALYAATRPAKVWGS